MCTRPPCLLLVMSSAIILRIKLLAGALSGELSLFIKTGGFQVLAKASIYNAILVKAYLRLQAQIIP